MGWRGVGLCRGENSGLLPRAAAANQACNTIPSSSLRPSTASPSFRFKKLVEMPSQLTKDHGKLVITLASTGNLNTKERNPALPCSPQEMADDVHECAKLGVAVFHIHSRDENNKPTMRVDVFRETCRLIKERDPNVIIQISTGAPPALFFGHCCCALLFCATG